MASVIAALWVALLVQPPKPSGVGLGPSWQRAITVAARDHLTFGRDVVFTYGPLGYVVDGVADPSLAITRALVRIAIAIVVAAALWRAVGRSASPLQRLAFGAVLALVGANAGIDYALLLGIVALLARTARFPRCWPAVGLTVGFAALFGALAKYTLAVDVIAAAAAVWAVDIARGPARRRTAALSAAGTAALVLVAGLFASNGFSAARLVEYIGSAAEIASGYSAATVGGPHRDIFLAFSVALATIAVGIAAWRERKPTLLPLAVVVLFLAWKHGFVRQDAHIVIFFMTAAGVTAILLVAVRRAPARILALGATALAVAAFAFTAQPALPSFERVLAGVRYAAAPVTTEALIARDDSAALAADRLPAALAAEAARATVDVLPSETAIVFANGFRWAPLPVFQSYSAYTPALDALNREALIARGASTILIDWRGTDQRLSFGEAPATMGAIACRYRTAPDGITAVGGIPYVVLRRDARSSCGEADAGSVTAHVGVPFAVPAPRTNGEFIVARIAMHPTAFVRIATLLFRAPPAFVRIAFADGTVTGRRLVVATAGDGIVLSPAPRDAREAARFFARGALPAVRSVTIESRPGAYTIDGIRFTRMTRRETSR